MSVKIELPPPPIEPLSNQTQALPIARSEYRAYEPPGRFAIAVDRLVERISYRLDVGRMLGQDPKKRPVRLGSRGSYYYPQGVALNEGKPSLIKRFIPNRK